MLPNRTEIEKLREKIKAHQDRMAKICEDRTTGKITLEEAVKAELQEMEDVSKVIKNAI